MDWTNDQKKAIEGRDGTMLVSAAAGSGKTAVLVQRVIELLSDPEKNCGIEDLLIVTFTKAAASQMKDKISLALSKAIAEDPTNKELKKKKLMLPYSNICTIDSFSINLVRENFHAAEIAPDFGIIDNSKHSLLKNKAIDDVLAERYKNKTEVFSLLNKLISDDKNDLELTKAVTKLYNISLSHAFPEDWLKSLYEKYDTGSSIMNTDWGIRIASYLNDCVSDVIRRINQCLDMLETEPELAEKYVPAFLSDRQEFEKIQQVIKNGSWESICSAVASMQFMRLGIIRNYESPVKEFCKDSRDKYKKSFDKEPFSSVLCISEEDFRDDICYLRPVVKELVDIVIEYGKALKELKDAENEYDFSDIMHLALKLLVEKKDGVITPTPLAEKLSRNYSQILVDEYQDVNEAQDLIFKSLSRNDTNRFLVGDVKQCIYRFRQAKPEIFLDLRNNMTDYDGVNYPARVTLSNNFRSRKGITEIVNFMFSQLMSTDVCGMDYNEKEFLYASAPYPEKESPDTELYLLEGEDPLREQAEFIGNYIQKFMKEETLTDGSAQRKPRFGDFCILMRGVRDDARTFEDVFREMGIPFSTEREIDFLNTPEVTFIVSLLKVIDNPADDIPLTAVMMSPAFGFTPDDLAEIRIADRHSNIYRCLLKARDDGNIKVSAFLDFLEKLRKISVSLPAGEFVSRIIDELGYKAIVGAMKNGSLRLPNVYQFIDTANRYEQSGKKGISGFVRFLDKIARNSDSIKSTGGKADQSDTVKLTTMHKSKGLEYPVCFIARTEKKFNDQDLTADLIISDETGIGFKRNIDRVKYNTVPRAAAMIETKKIQRAEELRVLYVALTRAKERLVILASEKDWDSKLGTIASNVSGEKVIDHYSVINMGGLSEYIISSLIKHPDAHLLRNHSSISVKTIKSDTPLKTELIKCYKEEPETAVAEAVEYPSDRKILKEISDRLSFRYPYEELNGVSVKRIASKLETEVFNDKYYVSDTPAFANRNGLTGAEKGIATHSFMQYADYEKAAKDPASELERLVDSGLLTRIEADSVDVSAVTGFFTSKIAGRIAAADKVYREYPFVVSVPVTEMYPEIPESVAKDEVVVIEGVIDCAFEEDGKLVIVDYKTDHAMNSAELVERYSSQLNIYRDCLSKVLEKEVSETIIYSFRLGETIVVPKA